MQTGAAVLIRIEKPWSTTLPVRSCFSQVCTPQNWNSMKIHHILNFSLPEMYTATQFILTLKEMVSREGLQTHFWGQNRPSGQGVLAVLTHAESMRETTDDPGQVRTSLRDSDRAQTLLNLNLLKKLTTSNQETQPACLSLKSTIPWWQQQYDPFLEGSISTTLFLKSKWFQIPH